MKFYLNSPLNLQINESKKNGQMHLLKTEKERKKFILYQTKTRTVRTYSHRNTKFSNRDSTKRWSISRYLGYHFRKGSQTTLLHEILATL